jgi:2-oxoglutarate dehydrogenase E1 component
MKKLLAALFAGAFVLVQAPAVLAQDKAPAAKAVSAADAKKAELKKCEDLMADAKKADANKAEAKKCEPILAEAKKAEPAKDEPKKKKKGGC